MVINMTGEKIEEKSVRIDNKKYIIRFYFDDKGKLEGAKAVVERSFPFLMSTVEEYHIYLNHSKRNAGIRQCYYEMYLEPRGKSVVKGYVNKKDAIKFLEELYEEFKKTKDETIDVKKVAGEIAYYVDLIIEKNEERRRIRRMKRHKNN